VDTLFAIAEPNRRKIIQLLAQRGNLTAGEIAGHFRSSAPAISQHLQVLREAKTVTVERQAQKRIYSLNPKTLRDLAGWLFDLTTQWEQRLDNLESLLREEKRNSPDSHKSQSKKGKR
jgi:DNA-binding transcriptional ArsR family regulator